MGFTIVTAIPDAINVKCLCYSCGLKDFPNPMSDWWCESKCCCLFNDCGLKELMTCQICILGPCPLTAPALKLTTSIPDMLVMNILCTKWGCQMPPDCRKENIIENKWFCLHNECGFKDLLDVFQFFCIKIQTGVKVGV